MSEPLFQDRITNGPQTPEDVTKSHIEDEDEAYERRRQYDEDKIMNEKSAEDFIPGDDELEPAKSVINFNINDKRIAEAKEEFKDVDAYKDLPAAKKAKQTLTKMRTTLAEAHKTQKADALAHCQDLDGEKRRLLGLIGEIEDPIKKDLDDIKNAEAIAEQQRLEKIQGNIDQVRSHGEQLDGLSMAALEARQESLALHQITEEIYQELQDSAQGAYYEAESRLRLAISKRQEFEEEEARLETQRLEQEARQKELDEQQAEIDRQAEEKRKEQAETDRLAREKQQAEDKERQDELDAQAEEQEEERKRLAEVIAAQQKKDEEKEEADRKEQAERDAETARLAAAPDVEKLEAFAQKLSELMSRSLDLQTSPGNRVMELSLEKLEALIDYILTEVEKMK